MHPLGVCILNTVHNGKPYKFRFEVVATKDARKPLISATTCQVMHLISFDMPKYINSITTNSAEAILDKYSDVFQGLGTNPAYVHLQTNPQVAQGQHTPTRKMPVALEKRGQSKTR